MDWVIVLCFFLSCLAVVFILNWIKSKKYSAVNVSNNKILQVFSVHWFVSSFANGQPRRNIKWHQQRAETEHTRLFLNDSNVQLFAREQHEDLQCFNRAGRAERKQPETSMDSGQTPWGSLRRMNCERRGEEKRLQTFSASPSSRGQTSVNDKA